MARKDANKGAKARKAENMRAALEYRKLGATERWIAERLGVSQPCVHRYIAQGLAELKERSLQTVEEMVTLESERIDQARFAVAAKVVRGELDAIDRWLKASSEYRKLHGLDAPEKRALTDPSGSLAWQPFDPKRLANLSPEQLEQFEEIMAVMMSDAGESASRSDTEAAEDDDE